MLRRIALVLAVLLVPTVSLATWTSVQGGGTDTIVTSVGVGQCVYERATATGQGALLSAPMRPVQVEMNCNVAGVQTGDVAAEVLRCASGTTAYSANTCLVTSFKNAAGTVVDVIDGDNSTLTQSLHAVASEVFVMNYTTHAGGGRISEIKLCVPETQ